VHVSRISIGLISRSAHAIVPSILRFLSAARDERRDYRDSYLIRDRPNREFIPRGMRSVDFSPRMNLFGGAGWEGEEGEGEERNAPL